VPALRPANPQDVLEVGLCGMRPGSECVTCVLASTRRSSRAPARTRLAATDAGGGGVKYRTIVADPPWPYPGGFKTTLATGRDHTVVQGAMVRRESPYDPMSLEAIRALPVAGLAEGSGARLFLWTTNTYLRVAFDVMAGWGFKYGQTLVWHKLNPSPWITSVAPNSAEFLLVGSMGSVGRLGKLASAVIAHGVPKEHSRKPELFMDLIEQVSPPPYVELFSRRHRLGWDVYGNESANTASLESA
jgi:N6-adenosine-specific RNA methylase IME4